MYYFITIIYKIRYKYILLIFKYHTYNILSKITDLRIRCIIDFLYLNVFT